MAIVPEFATRDNATLTPVASMRRARGLLTIADDLDAPHAAGQRLRSQGSQLRSECIERVPGVDRKRMHFHRVHQGRCDAVHSPQMMHEDAELSSTHHAVQPHLRCRSFGKSTHTPLKRCSCQALLEVVHTQHSI